MQQQVTESSTVNTFISYICSLPYFSSPFLLLTLLSFFLISNSRPTVVNVTCNEWKSKSPALCSTGLFTSKSPPFPHSSVLCSVLFLYISTYFLHITLSKQHPFYSVCCLYKSFFLPIFSCSWLNSLLKVYISLLQFYDAAGAIFFSPILLKPENSLLQKVLFSVLFSWHFHQSL